MEQQSAANATRLEGQRCVPGQQNTLSLRLAEMSLPPETRSEIAAELPPRTEALLRSAGQASSGGVRGYRGAHATPQPPAGRNEAASADKSAPVKHPSPDPRRPHRHPSSPARGHPGLPPTRRLPADSPAPPRGGRRAANSAQSSAHRPPPIARHRHRHRLRSAALRRLQSAAAPPRHGRGPPPARGAALGAGRDGAAPGDAALSSGVSLLPRKAQRAEPAGRKGAIAAA